ncbi:carbonic anhydrase 2-like isoform X2 [Daktulosphaira vitifoliae]|nr:carbonic anhydrase 2-like isoform X2 [Daktulosphaira vitifoliae]XP_050530783.1 carbonic anhydrase 2-like isoform X2 [Daktulosphaira vitifoliae]XP_050530792.1 carbonic anhydrase 2-like isoform X2 [Daktulosphaira vitifoliae]
MLPPFQHVGYWGDDEILVNVTNNGHTVYVSLTNDEQNIPIGVTGGPLFDDLYMFDQLHLHWGEHDEGSEHKFNGQSYAMEIHLVHHKIDYGTFNEALKYYDGLCVVSYFGEISEEDDEEMTNFINDLQSLIEPGSSVIRLIGEEFFWLKKTADQIDYFAYPGSLTTEPYAESVTWIAFTIPFKISRKQLAKFRNLRSHDSGVLINKNDRELQEFNNRPIVYV